MFNGTDDAYISYGTDTTFFMLSHSFSVHAWVMPFVLDDMTIFSKDWDGADGAINLLALGVTSAGKLVTSLALDTDSTDFSDKLSSGSGALEANTWALVAYHFHLSSNKDTTVTFYINNTEDSTADYSERFLIDSTTAKPFLGIQRETDTGTFIS
jgi:hypothetical protein